MIEVIEREMLPLGVRLPQTDRDVVGGYFVWLTLPDSVEGAALAQRAKDEENVVVAQVSTEHATTPVPRLPGPLTYFQGDIFEVGLFPDDMTCS
jgi:hypothetical protein